MRKRGQELALGIKVNDQAKELVGGALQDRTLHRLLNTLEAPWGCSSMDHWTLRDTSAGLR